MQLTVRTVSGLPAFKLPCEKTDSIGAVTKRAAKLAHIEKHYKRYGAREARPTTDQKIDMLTIGSPGMYRP